MWKQPPRLRRHERGGWGGGTLFRGCLGLLGVKNRLDFSLLDPRGRTVDRACSENVLLPGGAQAFAFIRGNRKPRQVNPLVSLNNMISLLRLSLNLEYR